VLDVTCQQRTAEADYNLWENLSMLAPKPKRWKLDLTLQVKRVVKGEFDDKTLELHWLREPTKKQYDSLGISPSAMFNFTNGTHLRIGFNGRSGQRFDNLEIMVRP
jgi:membrane-bound lytic murein transglycosylase